MIISEIGNEGIEGTMKTLIAVSLVTLFSFLVISCATIPQLQDNASRGYSVSVKTLIKIALQGEKDIDGDWTNKRTNDDLELTVFYIIDKVVGYSASDGFNVFVVYYDPLLNQYSVITIMGGQIIDIRELSYEDFGNLVKKFLELWEEPKTNKIV